MELNFKEYDVARNKEDEIYEILIKKSNNTNIPEIAQHIVSKKDILMVRTLMSTLFKIRSKALYNEKELLKSCNLLAEKALYAEGLIGEFYLNLNRRGLKGIKRVLIENASMINEDLMDYYAERNQNYIADKFFIKTILDQDNTQELLGLNPLEINELLSYQQKPLTAEEEIIREIIDYFMESQEFYDSPDDIKHVQNLIKENNNGFKRIIKKSYMISNVYQHARSQDDKIMLDKIVNPIESDRIKGDEAYDYIMRKYEKDIIRKFVEYNIDLEEGRLEELKKEPSAVYAKKIYKNIK